MREPNAVDKYIRVNPQTRMFEPVWMYRDVLPYMLCPDPARSYSTTTGAITVPASGQITVPYKLPHSSLGMDDAVGNPLNIDQIVFSAPAAPSIGLDYSVFLTDMGDQRQFMNFPIHVRTFAGSGQLSARLTEDLFLPTRHQLMATLSNNTNSSLVTYLQFAGKLFDTWSSNLQKYQSDRRDMIAMINKALERRKYVFPYWMTPQNGGVVVPANQTVEVDALVGSEGHFEASHILRAFTNAVATTSPFEVEIINPQTRQALMNGRIHSYMIGDSLNPQPLPANLVVPAGQLIRFKITDLSGSTNTVYLTLRGRKIRADFKDIAQAKADFGIVDEPKGKNQKERYATA